ncbi:hypothetical protein CEXT_216741 [Caerostris extrusa]|uniref:Uncharacterized protein n=1 Tax=Caerostris extrusa TaxID=172846 RepID=A0AAV4VRB8_CAEEX|nr:hypothetical protein CEXT_216741 [Caerostris extrusa]
MTNCPGKISHHPKHPGRKRLQSHKSSDSQQNKEPSPAQTFFVGWLFGGFGPILLPFLGVGLWVPHLSPTGQALVKKTHTHTKKGQKLFNP